MDVNRYCSYACSDWGVGGGGGGETPGTPLFSPLPLMQGVMILSVCIFDLLSPYEV